MSDRVHRSTCLDAAAKGMQFALAIASPHLEARTCVKAERQDAARAGGQPCTLAAAEVGDNGIVKVDLLSLIPTGAFSEDRSTS
jgi:hypothetical protein